MKTFEKVEEYQKDFMFHKLTCDKDSDHRPLTPVIVKNKLRLVCLDCDYSQEHIPEFLRVYD